MSTFNDAVTSLLTSATPLAAPGTVWFHFNRASPYIQVTTPGQEVDNIHNTFSSVARRFSNWFTNTADKATVRGPLTIKIAKRLQRYYLVAYFTYINMYSGEQKPTSRVLAKAELQSTYQPLHLKIGKYELLNGEKGNVYPYDIGIKLIRSDTRKTIDNIISKGYVPETIYRAIRNRRGVYSTYVTFTKEGKPYILARKEYDSNQSGQTIFYSETFKDKPKFYPWIVHRDGPFKRVTTLTNSVFYFINDKVVDPSKWKEEHDKFVDNVDSNNRDDVTDLGKLFDV